MRYLNEIELHSNIRRQAVSSPIGRASHAGTGEQLRGPEVTGDSSYRTNIALNNLGDLWQK